MDIAKKIVKLKEVKKDIKERKRMKLISRINNFIYNIYEDIDANYKTNLNYFLTYIITLEDLQEINDLVMEKYVTYVPCESYLYGQDMCKYPFLLKSKRPGSEELKEVLDYIETLSIVYNYGLGNHYLPYVKENAH